jgi:hypothetical protein
MFVSFAFRYNVPRGLSFDRQVKPGFPVAINVELV